MTLEPLENRQLLSASCGGGGVFGGGGFGGGPGDNTIAFSLAPTAVQTGLDALASTDGLTAPTSTTTVDLNNTNGVETYSITLDGTGTVSTLTVDQLGDPVTAPTHTTTTWATLDGTGTGSDSAAATEITKIATALDLTAPVSTDTVNVSTTSAGVVTYNIQLSSANTSTGTTWGGNFGGNITVDSAGDPVGNQQLPFSVFSTTIQNALNTNKPTGATALASTSTQNVNVQDTDGVTTYSTTFTASGTTTTVTVNAAGTLTSLPTTTTTTFSALSPSLQTELQTLATADGVTTAIASTQSVTKLTETNGTVLYSVSLENTANGSSGSTYTFDVTITVDSNGNPTTLPKDGAEFGGFGYGGPGPGQGHHDHDGSTANSSTGTTSNASTPIISVPVTGIPTSSSETATAATSASSSIDGYTLSSSLLTSLTSHDSQLASLGKYLVEFATTKVDSAVETDVVGLIADESQLASDTKSLTKTQKSTFSSDDKAIASAIKAVNAALTTQNAKLKSDAAAYLAKFKADQKAINKDKKNATALAVAEAQMSADKSAAFSAIAGDVTSIETSIDSAGSVTTAQAKLASDLPAIATDQTAIQSGTNQLISDINSQLASA